MKTIIEPFRMKVIEPIRMTTREEREQLLARCDYNLFALHSDDVLIDLLTDSGTGAMSANQLSAMMRGDESYAGSPSFYRFQSAVQKLMPLRHVIPTHQGRAAEAILFSLVGGPGKVIPSNTHFDTTRGNIEATGAEALDLPTPQAADFSSQYPFKGDADLKALERLLDGARCGGPGGDDDGHQQCGRRPAGLHGQPARGAGVVQPLWQAAVHRRLPLRGERLLHQAARAGVCAHSIADIARAMFALADGMTMSAKKDGLANIGGWLALNDDELARRARNRLILTEGFPTYGGLAGRDLEAIAVGLEEVVDEQYLRYRVRCNEYIGDALRKLGVPIVNPVGGHAVFVDARGLLPHIPPLQYPGQALAVALYELGGVRACEIGTVMFGRQPDGREQPARYELVRLAMPRRVYTQSHADYLVEVFEELVGQAPQLRGFRISYEAPQMRHFTARFARL